VTLKGVTAVMAVERAKLAAQIRVRLVLAACVAGPFAFAGAMRVQSSTPDDTLFGRAVNESGFALSLVVLGFTALWGLPVVASIVAGDVFAAEDRHGTWKLLLTRSRSRSELFAGKVAAALAFSSIALVVMAVSSLAAGVTVVGVKPLVSLSGALLEPSQALTRVALAWLSVLPPVCGLSAIAIALSVVTRNSAAAIGLPVVAALTMQLCALIDGPALAHRVLLTSAFDAWHGLLAQPAYYGPVRDGMLISAIYFAIALAIAYRALDRRDVAG
jgi:ABC-2 type transport system permease protein